jgi:hypothetical protein
MNVNNPATKNAVLILSNCPCDKCKLCFKAELYIPNAYDVPPVVAEAIKAHNNKGILDIIVVDVVPVGILLLLLSLVVAVVVATSSSSL